MEDKIQKVFLETFYLAERRDNEESDPNLNRNVMEENLELAKILGNHFAKHNIKEECAGKLQRM